ncbi:hypothetical protein Pelo_10776 [Pelomyxa schiedti]|nr:hypothetical protein Pelo_10776 [Pelomyxa schiedti]
MCTPSQVQVMNEYSNTFTNTLDSIKTLYEPGNGAFISSCLSHCTEDYDRAWTSLSIDGVTLQQAVSKWWHSSKDTPASDNTYKPCLYTEDPPVECNPTCVEGWTE